MKNNPAVPGGSLKSKPTWSNSFGYSATSAFFVVLLLHEPPRCCRRDSACRHHSLSIQAEEECLMRVFMSSFVALLALVAFGPGVTGTALGGDNGTNAGTNVGNAGVAGAPAIAPLPAPVPAPALAPAPPTVPAPALAPAPPPIPAPTLAPTPALSPAPAGQVRDEVGNPGATQTPGAAVNVRVPGNANAGVAANQGGDHWRYRWHNNNWWYWTTENRWVYRNGNEWVNYEPAVAAVPAVGYSNQPVDGSYQSSPNGYYPGPYRYSTGYGGYYGPVYQGGYYYGPGGYYGQPGISVGLGFGFRRGLRFGY